MGGVYGAPGGLGRAGCGPRQEAPPSLPPALPGHPHKQAAAAGETEARGGGSPPGVPAVGGASAIPRPLNPPRVPRVRTPKTYPPGVTKDRRPLGKLRQGKLRPGSTPLPTIPDRRASSSPSSCYILPSAAHLGRAVGRGARTRSPAAVQRQGRCRRSGAAAPPSAAPSLPPSADAASPPLPSLQLNRQTLGKSHPRGGGPGAAGPCRHTKPGLIHPGL